jgi:hypothetical protein
LVFGALIESIEKLCSRMDFSNQLIHAVLALGMAAHGGGTCCEAICEESKEDEEELRKRDLPESEIGNMQPGV